MGPNEIISGKLIDKIVFMSNMKVYAKIGNKLRHDILHSCPISPGSTVKYLKQLPGSNLERTLFEISIRSQQKSPSFYKLVPGTPGQMILNKTLAKISKWAYFSILGNFQKCGFVSRSVWGSCVKRDEAENLYQFL